MKNHLKKTLFVLLLAYVPTYLNAHILLNDENGCEVDETSKGLLSNTIFDKACGVNKGLGEKLCGKINPFPSTDDYIKECFGAPLSSIPHKHPKGEPGGPDKNFGEPHLITRDRLRYSFQAQGDFALIVADGLEVQARYTNMRRATVVRGIAVKIGDTVIAIEDSDNPSSVWIEGVKATLNSGDWYALNSTTGVVQRLGDGILIRAERAFDILINRRYLEIQLNPKYAGQTQGLLGNGDGDPSNDLRTAIGDSVDATDPKSLYGQFMMDWRRDGNSSLFPAPFNYIGDPNAVSQNRLNLSDIEPAQRGAASKKCLAAGLKSGAGLDECTYDLAMTGDDSFIKDTLAVADSLRSTISATALTTQDISVFSLENDASVSKGIPTKGAGELERSFNLDRYTIAIIEPIEYYLKTKQPCTPSSTLKALIRKNGRNLNEYSLRCDELLSLPIGVVEIDVYSSVGDIINYAFDIVDSSGKILERKVNVSIKAPEETATGEKQVIFWEAPVSMEGHINIQLEGEEPNFDARPYVLTQGKSSAKFRMPSAAGDYVLRWYNRNDREMLAEQPVVLTAATVAINPIKETIAGTETELSWAAPSGLNGLINIQLASEEPSYDARPYVNTGGKTSIGFRMPSAAGDYVLRWYNRNDREMLAEQPVVLTAATVAINPIKETIAGTETELSWAAPSGLNGLINIQLASEEPSYDARPYVNTGGKTSIGFRMPSAAGDYVLRWYNRNDREMLAEQPVVLTAATVAINPIKETIAGTEVELSWAAPSGLNGLINIQLASEEPSYDARPYVNTGGKTSVGFRMPSTAGDYVLRWYNRNDRTMLAERKVRILPSE